MERERGIRLPFLILFIILIFIGLGVVSLVWGLFITLISPQHDSNTINEKK